MFQPACIYACVKGHLEPTHLKSSPLFTFSTKPLGQDAPSVHLFSKTKRFRPPPLNLSRGGRKRLPKFKFSAKFPIGLHVILQIQIKKFENDCFIM